MALAQYGTLITTIGLAQIANAQITQTKVGLEYIALGDGNGAHYVPTQNQTALVHEVWRGPIAELSIDPTNNNRIIIDAVIPVTAGGFTIREIGIFDDKNQLIAIGQYPEKYKPQLSEGVSEETLIHFVIETNNADVVKLNIDPTVIIATRKYVDAKVADAVGNIGTDLTELKTEVTTHKDEIATIDKLGHIKPDGTTIRVDPLTGVASAQEQGYQLTDGNKAKVFDGNLNNLTAFGFYTITVDGTIDNNFPLPVKAIYDPIIEVFRGKTDNWIIQRITWGINQGNNVYVRTKVLGNWNAWESMVVGDSGDIAVNPSVGWTVDKPSDLVVRKINQVVHFRGNVKMTSTTSSLVFCKLPVEYRPFNYTPLTIMGKKGSNEFDHLEAMIDPNGDVFLTVDSPPSQLAAGTKYTFDVQFLLN